MTAPAGGILEAAAVLMARSLLGLTLLSAGVMKLRRPGSIEATTIELGLPWRSRRLMAWAVPALEISIGVSLFVPGWSSAGAVAAITLLGAFAATAVTALLTGRKLSCNCFGSSAPRPVTWRTILRNAALIAVAVLIAQAPGTPSEVSDRLVSIVSWQSALMISVAIAWLSHLSLTVILLWRLSLLSERMSTMDRALLSSSVDRDANVVPAPAFTLRSRSGDVVTLDNLLAHRKDILLVFLSPACTTCSAVLADVGRWQRELAHRLLAVVVSRDIGDVAPSQHYADLANVFYEVGREVSQLYGVHGTPAAVVIRKNASLGTTAIFGRAQITEAVLRASVTAL